MKPALFRSMSGLRALGRVARFCLRPLWRALVPYTLRHRLRERRAVVWFRGAYPDWASARVASGGYADKLILDRVLAATLAVRDGRAAFERDSVLFYTLQADEPLLRILTEIAQAAGGKLSVLDFGGSLGTNYWRHRNWLPAGDKLCWDVVEQTGFVEAGKQFQCDTPLRFHMDMRSAEAGGWHDVLLCSTVLQYLEKPFEILAAWRDSGIPLVLLNNLPLDSARPDRICVQHVPPEIYPATYPVWFFNRAAFLEKISRDYEVLKEFESEAVWRVDFGMFPSTGLLLRRRAST